MGNNSSSNQEKDVVFSSDETYKEAGIVIWLHDNLLNLSYSNFSTTTDTILELYELRSEGNIYQFIFNIILIYRIRPLKTELYSNLLQSLCEKLKDPSFLKRYFLRYMTFTFNFREPNIIATPYLSLLYLCFKKGLFTTDEIFEQIKYIKENYSEFPHYICSLYCWFYIEIEQENTKLFKSLKNIFLKECKRWIFPNYIKTTYENLEYLIKDSNALFDEFRKTGFIPGTIFYSIANDDINDFKNYASSPSFNVELELEESIFLAFPLLHYSPHIIQVAAFFGALKIFKYLLLNNASIECVDKAGLSLVHFAIAGGNAEIIRILEQKEVSFKGTQQVSVQYYQKIIFEWLTENKFPDLSEIDSKYGSIAHNAAISNNLDTLLYLENENIDFTTSNDNNGISPLHYACSNGCFDSVYFLISSPKSLNNINNVDLDLDTVLHVAAYHGWTHIAQLLMSTSKKLIKARNKAKFTPVQIAAINGHDILLHAFLKQRHVNINDSTQDGRTLLHLSVINGHYAAAKEILSHQKVFVSASDNDNCTPLHYAAKKNHYSCVKLLLKQNGININSLDNNYVISLFFF